MLKAIVREPNRPANATVIWMHGLGASGHDFADAIPELKLPNHHSIRFIFPHAPEQAVTLNGGMIMPAWYDIYGLGAESFEDEPGLRRAKINIDELITHEIQRGISSQRIILAGFSQGGALALYTGLRSPHALGGILALSTYLPLAFQLPQEGTLVNKVLPIWMAHGSRDPVVSFGLGDLSRKHLEAQGYNVEWQTYPMMHTVCPEELQTIGRWLETKLL